MVSATLHVIATELAIGAYATAGVAFLLAGLASHGLFGLGRHLAPQTSRPISPCLRAAGHALRHGHRHRVQSR